jgi:GGDEF domain-containing protein
VELYRLDILDSPSSECFERVARLAARLFEVPYVTIALVDAVREWCLARHGQLPSEAPRERSFADLVIRSGDLLAVEDAASSLAMFDHPLVVGPPKARFLAGHPLRCASGELLGAICLLAPGARKFGPAEAQLLRELAGVVEDELVLRANRCFDERTGLLLRRGLDIVAAHVASRASRRGEAVSLVVLDIDMLFEGGTADERPATDQMASPMAATCATTSSEARAADLTAQGATSARRAAEKPAAGLTTQGGTRGRRAAEKSAAGRTTLLGARTDVQAAVDLVAGVVNGVTRSSDVPARLPCDEIVVLLPDTDDRRCATIARRLHDEIGHAVRRAAPPFGFVVHLATATLDDTSAEMSLAALLRTAEPFDMDLCGARRARAGAFKPGPPTPLRPAAPRR